MRQPDLEIDLLRTFVTVAEAGSFTTAGDILGRTQSAVSQQVRRLEDIVDRKLFERTSRTVGLTSDGELLLAHACAIITQNDEAMRRMKAPPVEGYLRLGIAEDFVPRQLPVLLARFHKAYPQVRLELMTGLSTMLVERLGDAVLDLVIAKRDAQPQSGRVIWREKLIWVAAPNHDCDRDAHLPIIALPAPCSYRKVMLDVLNSAQRRWRVTCTTHSILGLQTAVAGGMGISVMGQSFLGWGLVEAPSSLALPSLPDTEIAIFGEERAKVELADTLADFLMDSLRHVTARDRLLPL